MQRHQGHGPAAALQRIRIGYQGHVLQKGSQGALSLGHIPLDLLDITDQLAQVVHAVLNLALFILYLKELLILQRGDHLRREIRKGHDLAQGDEFPHGIGKGA